MEKFLSGVKMSREEWFQRCWDHLERSLAQQGKKLVSMDCEPGKTPTNIVYEEVR